MYFIHNNPAAQHLRSGVVFYLYGVGLFLPPVRFGTYPATIFVFYGATLGHILDEILCREICEYYKLKCE